MSERIVFRMLNVLVALMLFIVIAFAAVDTPWGKPRDITYIDGQGNVTDQSGIKHVGKALLTTYVLPFEVLSLLLLAALIGAIYLAKKEESQ
ncbi:MAG TPA: dehydrogenase [Candidatus Methanoperedenaceae archaeon]|nr:dehydrogenase [Candidatus Methanoperedenaceae archaeon]